MTEQCNDCRFEDDCNYKEMMKNKACKFKDKKFLHNQKNKIDYDDNAEFVEDYKNVL